MPIYAYSCASCGHAQDVLQKLSDPVLTQLPSLRRERVGQADDRRRLPAQGLRLVRRPTSRAAAGDEAVRRRRPPATSRAGGKTAGTAAGRRRAAADRRLKRRLRQPATRLRRLRRHCGRAGAPRRAEGRRSLKRYLIAGLLVWLPLAITIWVLLWVLGALDGVFAGCSRLPRRCCRSAAHAAGVAAQVPGLGVIVMVVGCC